MSLQPEEITILEKVINIRNRLTALKQNRAEYIKSQDVLNIYQAVVKQVEKLNDLRDQETGPHVPNRLDTLLADVFSLLSLFFLTIGKARECPATYSQIASMRQLLDHMNESAVYTEADLKSFRNRLDELRDIVRNDKESGLHPPAMTKLLDRKLNECDAILSDLQDSLSVLSVELVPIHQRLVMLRRQLVALAAKPKPFKADLKPIMEDLRKIESKRENGKFLGPNGVVPASQALCSGLLEECFDIAQEIRAREDDVSTALKPIHDRLWDMRAQLEQLVLTHRWTLRETDLWNYSQALQEIDKMRVNGKFVDAEGTVPSGQYVLLYLLRRCYGLIHRLLSSSEPVSEELMPIANKLSTVKKCLNEVLKFGGPFNPRDLYPYQLALFQIDSLRKDGKFIGSDGSVPEGQGIVMAHLNECHELLEMLKEAMEEGEGEDDYEYDYGSD
ncbi:unnamed protein product [Rhizoctonia solani]|uniref:Uncharacterized protein n=1 Tax=Rhizoctonia solani TaxID=456999 RepID=A0A8H3HB14_9AGAM|nr:unnamed protein product [Rhizoctonia solani]